MYMCTYMWERVSVCVHLIRFKLITPSVNI